ncbi:MAG: FAD-dependent monooxygenase [Sphingobacteriales bacterium]|nr:MAG: FAD-dependent monooxygenase [Sphingobacteriales bacterium]
MLLKDKQIAIIGGGPGGLTLARLLQVQGAGVQVYERDKDEHVRQQGATLDLHETSGLAALRRAGLMAAFYARYRPGAGKMRVVDEQAQIRMDDHAAGHYEDQRPEIDRAPLRDILLDALAPGTVLWDRRFTHMEKQQEGWLLHFANGTKAYADLVIAADGANSKLRAYLTPIPAIYSGITIVEGNIYQAAKNAPRLWALAKGGKVFALGKEQSLILSTKGDGSLSFYTGTKVPENWAAQSGINFSDKAQVFDWFKTEFSAWEECWQELFHSNEIGLVPRPQYHFPPDQSWPTSPNLTLLGDAAHRMPPYAGEGVNMAMQDALELAECLSSNDFTGMQEAIAQYEQQMLQRAARVTQHTLDNTALMHSENGLERLLQLFQEMGKH